MSDASNSSVGSRPEDTGDLLERVNRSWAALEQMIEAIGDDQLAAAGEDGGWSIKDHLAHITTWEQILLARLTGKPDYEVVGMTAETFYGSDIDALNAAIFMANKDRTASDVRAKLQESHREVVTALEQLS